MDASQLSNAPKTSVTVERELAFSMGTSLALRVQRAYVPWSLFLSGYAPLALIFAMRLIAKSRPVKAEACVLIAVVLVANLIGMLLIFRSAPRDFSVAKVESLGGELAAYVATYLLPFAMVGDVTNWDLAAYAAFLFIVGVVSVRADLVHLNPLLALRGYRIFTITTGKGRSWLALSLDRIREGDDLKARIIAGRLLLVTENVTAREQTQL